MERSELAQDLGSAALDRLAGHGGDLGELRRDAARLGALLSAAPSLADPTTPVAR